MKYGNIRDLKKELLSDNHFILNKFTFEYQKEDGTWEPQMREAYDHGNGAAILLFNSETQSLVLTRQFRFPTFINGNVSGMMIEVCAGLLEADDPETCIIKEVFEETGYQIEKVEKIYEAYMTPGSVTEKLHFFIGEYTDDMKVGSGGGVEGESENIEVLEITFAKALEMVKSGEIDDAKTIMLLQYAQINGLI